MDDFDTYLEKQVEWMQDQVKRLLANPSFQDSVKEIRSMMGVETPSINLEFTVDLQLAMGPHIRNLRKEYDLDRRWETFLSKYILWGLKDGFMFGPIIDVDLDKVTGKFVYSIRVSAETREEDVLQAYRLISDYHRNKERIAGYTVKRSDPYDNLERDALWYEWHNDKKLSSREIARRYVLETGGPEPNHTTVIRGIKKYERIILNRTK